MSLTPVACRLARSHGSASQEVARVDLCKALDSFAESVSPASISSRTPAELLSQIVGPFFSGPDPSIPDFALAPFVARARSNGGSDAGAGKSYQDYADHLLQLDCLRRTSPSATTQINVRSLLLRALHVADYPG